MLATLFENAAGRIRPEFNIYTEIDRIENELREIAENRDVVNSVWWQKYKKIILDIAVGYEGQIKSLLNNPAKNEIEIVRKVALSDALKILISSIEMTLEGELDLHKRKIYLEKITRSNQPI